MEIPFERLIKRSANYDHLKVIGCLCYANNTQTKGDKFAPKATRCVLLGYPPDQKGYRVFDLESIRIFVPRDVVFKEHIFSFKQIVEQFSNILYSLPSSVDDADEMILFDQEQDAQNIENVIEMEDTFDYNGYDRMVHEEASLRDQNENVLLQEMEHTTQTHS